MIENGKMRKGRFTSLNLNELSAVDFPAQAGARHMITKAGDTSVMVAKYCDDEKGAKSFATLFERTERREKEWQAQQELWPAMDALRDSLNSIMVDLSLSAETRETMIRSSVDDFLIVVREKAPEVEAEIRKFVAGAPGDNDGKDHPMTTEVEKKLAEANQTIETQKGEIETLKAANETLTQKAKDAEDAKEKAEAETAEAKKALDATIEVDGVVISKAANPEAYAVAKSAETRIATVTAEKRAETEFGAVVGTAAEKALVIQAIAGQPEPVRKAFDAIMTSAQTMASKAFDRLGIDSAEVEKAKGDFMAEVEKIKTEKNLSDMDAMREARKAHPDLYDAYQAKTAA